MKRTLTVLLALVLALPFMLSMVGCSTNPATGKSQFNALSREQSIALGEEAAPQLVQEYGGEVEDPALRQYLTDIGQSMVPYTEGDYPSLPWEFYFLDSDVINAFALPGGKVFMSRGLAEIMDNEAQFAAVVGHEMGHVTARHINDRVANQMAIQGLGIGAVILAGQGAGAWAAEATNIVVGSAGQGFMLKFSRDDELEADRLGVRYMTKVGYDPLGAKQMQQNLGAASQGAPPEILSTHPASSTRISQMNKLLEGEYGYTQNNPEYQLYPERYQSAVLSRMAHMDPPKHRVPIGVYANLGDPTTWCAHCRAEAETATP